MSLVAIGLEPDDQDLRKLLVPTSAAVPAVSAATTTSSPAKAIRFAPWTDARQRSSPSRLA
jgi:hypothetical protein